MIRPWHDKKRAPLIDGREVPSDTPRRCRVQVVARDPNTGAIVAFSSEIQNVAETLAPLAATALESYRATPKTG